MDELDLFSKLVLGLVKRDWYDIKSPKTKEWDEEFDKRINNRISSWRGNPRFTESEDTEEQNHNSLDFSAMDKSKQFRLCYDILNIMEGLWLEGRRMIQAIKQCEKGNALSLDDVVGYAIRLRDSTYSPPENSNIRDPGRHYEMFPQYHFLGMRSVEQMHASKLFGLHKLSKKTSSPKILFERISDNMHKMCITCAAENSTIYYQTSRVNPQQRCPETGRPTQCMTVPTVYDEKKKLHFKTDCNPFTVHAWATCKGLDPSEIVHVTYNPSSSDCNVEGNDRTEEPAKDYFGLMLGRET